MWMVSQKTTEDYLEAKILAKFSAETGIRKTRGIEHSVDRLVQISIQYMQIDRMGNQQP